MTLVTIDIMSRSIPVIDFADYVSGDESRRQSSSKSGRFIEGHWIFALENHGIPVELIKQSYDKGDEFFGLRQEEKCSMRDETSLIKEAILLLVLNMPRTIQHQI